MSTAGVTLNWNTINGASKYVLQRKIGTSLWKPLAEATATTYVDETAQMGETYRYTVSAVIDGVQYESSDPVTVLFNPFTDVPSSGKTLEYVSWAFNNGIVTGTSSTKFSPNNDCTRLQFVMMLWKMHGSPTVKGTNPFSDVTGAKATKAILWALDKGIINSGKTFNANGSITRVNIVMILWKLAGSPKVSGTNPFTDVSGNKTTNAVLWAYNNSITKGTTSTTFSPDNPCTRLQLVVFLYKYNGIYHVI